jgi:serine/threonine protein phosphatase PrpC
MLCAKFEQWFMRKCPPHGSNFLPGLPVVLATDIGLSRLENQDRVAAMRVNATGVTDTFMVVAVADGMGGMRDGAKCAALTLSSFFNSLIRFRYKEPAERLQLATLAANDAVFKFSRGHGGATLSALLVGTKSEEHYLVNVGDSRIYTTLTERIQDEVHRLTVDDSLEEAVGGTGRELLQFIGMGEGLKPHVKKVPTSAKRILVTSDGVHFINHEVLSDVLLNAEAEADAADELITVAKWRGAPDNASLAVVGVSSLFDSLNLTEETGIEVWDPFSSLHIMWMKPEKLELQEAEVALQKNRDRACQGDISKDYKEPKTNQNPLKPPKPPTQQKTRKPRVKRTDADIPQLTIDIPGMTKNEE